jgi:hypothetical protein
MEKIEETEISREHKDRLFKKVFSRKKSLLNLYNAVNGTAYDNPDDIEVNTIEDFLYLSMKNDVSFLFTDTINLYEHQSSVNPNMPFRGFIYLAKLYQKTVFDNHDFFSSNLVQIPTPQFVVFYNGKKEEPDRKELHLSDAFVSKGKFEPALECKAIVLNINYQHNKELMDKCKELRDYALLIFRIRQNCESGMAISEAIDKAIDDCIKDDVLKDILEKHRQEAKSMLFTEYNEEAHINNEKKISYADGIDLMSELYVKLEDMNRVSDYSKAVRDPDYRNQLIKELLPDKALV